MAFPIQRKMALISPKKGLIGHSAISMVKKAVAGINDTTTPYHKTLFMEKCLVQALDKYVLSKVEDADAWTAFMQQEPNRVIRSLYLRLAELDRMWVILQQRYRLELPEQRKIFKQLLLGEQEIAKLRKQAGSTATKVAQMQRKVNEAVIKIGNNAKSGMIKLQTTEAELNTAVRLDKRAQKKHAIAVDNHRKYKYNEVKKMLKRLAEVELQLHRDCCRISEVKSQLCDMYLEESFSKLDETTINQVSKKSAAILNSLCKELGIATVKENQPDRHVRTSSAQLRPPNPRLPDKPLPSAPSHSSLMKTHSVSSQEDEFDFEACYKPIPDEDDSDDDDYEPNYIYNFDGKNIIKDVDDVDDDDDDDDDDEYEYVPPEVGHTWKSFADDDKAPDEPPQYLDMLGDNTKEYQNSQQRTGNNRGVIRSKSSIEDDIFGSISSLQLERRNLNDKQRSKSGTPDDETEQEWYGHLWQSGTATGNRSSGSSAVSSRSGKSTSSSTGSEPSSDYSRLVATSSQSRQQLPLPTRMKPNK